MQSATVNEALLGWHGSYVGKKRKKVWRAAPLCLFWTIWRERNIKSFENGEHSVILPVCFGLSFGCLFSLFIKYFCLLHIKKRKCLIYLGIASASIPISFGMPPDKDSLSSLTLLSSSLTLKRLTLQTDLIASDSHLKPAVELYRKTVPFNKEKI